MPSRDSFQDKYCSVVNTEKSVWRAVVFLEEGGQDQDREAVRVYLIRLLADLPLGWYTGCVIEYFLFCQLLYFQYHM